MQGGLGDVRGTAGRDVRERAERDVTGRRGGTGEGWKGTAVRNVRGLRERYGGDGGRGTGEKVFALLSFVLIMYPSMTQLLKKNIFRTNLSKYTKQYKKKSGKGREGCRVRDGSPPKAAAGAQNRRRQSRPAESLFSGRRRRRRRPTRTDAQTETETGDGDGDGRRRRTAGTSRKRVGDR